LIVSPKNLGAFPTLDGLLVPGIFQILQSQKTLLKYITHLDLFTLFSNPDYRSFQGFAHSCPNLSSLTFGFICRSISSHYFRGTRIVRSPFDVETNYLQTVETFKNLKSLELQIADSPTFLKDFSAPSSIRHVKLRFEEMFSKETMFQIDSKYTTLQIPKIVQEIKFFSGFTTSSTASKILKV